MHASGEYQSVPLSISCYSKHLPSLLMIELQDSNSSNATPVIKAQRIGEVARIALVRYEQRAMKKDGAEVINTRTGKPRQELIVHGLALPGMTANAGLGDVQEVPTPGTPCRFILRGGGFGSWIDARKGHRSGKLAVGDVVERTIEFAQAYHANGDAKGGQITNQGDADKLPRSTSIGFYGPIVLRMNDDAASVAAAEAAYQAWQQSQQTMLDEEDDEFA